MKLATLRESLTGKALIDHIELAATEVFGEENSQWAPGINTKVEVLEQGLKWAVHEWNDSGGHHDFGFSLNSRAVKLGQAASSLQLSPAPNPAKLEVLEEFDRKVNELVDVYSQLDAVSTAAEMFFDIVHDMNQVIEDDEDKYKTKVAMNTMKLMGAEVF
jgi:hypothetical protein